MNDNYLWDKSGESDEEMQQLESLLSEFRYQPRPLVLPEARPEAIPQVQSKAMIYSFAAVRYGAIAAIALLTIGIGIWLSVRPATNTPEEARTIATLTPTITPQPPIPPTPQVVAPVPLPQMVKQLHASAPKAHFAKHVTKRAPRKSLQQEGEEAREKVLYALQITSEKLNLIAKKVQTDTN